jgi:hypothetical protein
VSPKCSCKLWSPSLQLAVRNLLLNFQPYRQYQNGYTELLGGLAGTREQDVDNPCTLAWHAAQSVIKFSSESAPEWLRNSWWCTSRFDIAPQD